MSTSNPQSSPCALDTRKLHFETLQLHVGQESPDPASDARAVPIYLTSSYVFRNSEHAAARFGLRDPGNIYSRLTKSTQDVLEQRIAALEGGIGALAVASGAAAITYSILNIARAGDHIVSAKTIYGGSYDLLQHTLVPYGITTTFVDPSDLANFEHAIRPETKALFIETFGNPNCNLIDIQAVADIAHAHRIPLIVDNTFATPFLLRPIEYGADVVVHSATKFIGGHGTTIGGVIVDSGKFDWKASGKFPQFTEPDYSYHGIVFADAVGPAAFITRARAILLRDTGATLSPVRFPAGSGNAIPARRAACGQCLEGRGVPRAASQSGAGQPPLPPVASGSCSVSASFPERGRVDLYHRTQGRSGGGFPFHRCAADLLAAGECGRCEVAGHPSRDHHAFPADVGGIGRSGHLCGYGPSVHRHGACG